MSSFPPPANQPAPSEDTPRGLTTAVQALIAASVAVLFLQVIFSRPAELAGYLGFETSALPGRWWTAVTYMFVHASGWHILANMYALYLFGPRVEAQWGPYKFVWFYLLCGLGGAVFDMLFIRSGALIGSSAAVFGVMTASVMQWPDDEVYFMFVLPMRIRTLAVGFFVFNLVMGVAATGVSSGSDSAGTNIAYLAHIGGVLAAYVYMRMAATSGIDLGRQRVANLPDADEPPRAIPRNLPRRERGDEVDDIVAKSKAIVAKRSATLTPSSRRRESRAEELNRVLDKISEHGIESLTSEERRVLEEMSRRLRDN